jgi:hypothetical protein
MRACTYPLILCWTLFDIQLPGSRVHNADVGVNREKSVFGERIGCEVPPFAVPVLDVSPRF